MTETEMKNEITALRALLARVAGECDVREVNGKPQSKIKPISLATYDLVTSAVWGDAGCPRMIHKD